MSNRTIRAVITVELTGPFRDVDVDTDMLGEDLEFLLQNIATDYRYTLENLNDHPDWDGQVTITHEYYPDA